MKVRLNVARSLVYKSEILFLDEPTSDSVNTRKIKNLVLMHHSTTVFITTHDTRVADELCDRVAFITADNIGIVDLPSSLKKYGRCNFRV